MLARLLGKTTKNKSLYKNAEKTVFYLAKTLGERTLREYENLNQAKEYIKKELASLDLTLEEEIYEVKGKKVVNLIGEKKGIEQPEKIIIVGAHYDTVEGTPGADDNASSIAALLELARLFSELKNKKTIRFVAFTLEEPPFFSTLEMGSMKYAAQCKDKKENIELMLCLEMLGFGGKKVKQNFPSSLKKEEVPNQGDFLTVVSLPSMSDYVYLWEKIYNKKSKKKIFKMIGPASVPGMDLSDHSSFIKYGYPAIMICDTGFYRNDNYHQVSDTYETINFNFLTENINSTFLTLKEIVNISLPSKKKN